MSLMCFYFEYEHVNKSAMSELGYLLTEQLEGVFTRIKFGRVGHNVDFIIHQKGQRKLFVG